MLFRSTQEALAGRANVLAGGEVFDAAHNIWKPTVLMNCNTSARVYCDEVFAPIATLEFVEDFNTGISRLNESRFGLQNAVFTNAVERVKQAFKTIRSGSVLINTAPGFRMDHMPYGGIKASGQGLEGIRYAMNSYTNERLLIW